MLASDAAVGGIFDALPELVFATESADSAHKADSDSGNKLASTDVYCMVYLTQQKEVAHTKENVELRDNFFIILC